ncbi:hypothetical protein [Rhizohabitans arisaemae]|uniref:hypothetical protein n=1 Tax=Rhizohabitans arisaemae TaxID=2720610 RepID=UPI0024B0856F|nr:hypothetical protein [Rhizohabitans arisaemae]
MSFPWLLRFGAVCGVLVGLSIGVPGVIESFTGETAATSFVIALGAAFGAPALIAFQLHQGNAAGRFGDFAFAVNLVGFGLFTGVAFALNAVIFFLDAAVAAELLRGPARLAILGATVVFVAGTVLFTVSMARARVYPRLPVYGYGVFLVALALAAPLPDSLLTSGLHVAVCASLIWLSLSVWSAAARRGDLGARSGRTADAALSGRGTHSGRVV